MSRLPKSVSGKHSAGDVGIIDQFGDLLGLKDKQDLADWRAASRHVIYIEAFRPGKFLVRYQEQNDDFLLISRQPLLDAARLFLKFGCDKNATIVMRRRGSTRDDLFGPIKTAAKLTVDESKTLFAHWKPFPQSAGLAGSAFDHASATKPRAPSKSARRSNRRRLNGNLIDWACSSDRDVP